MDQDGKLANLKQSIKSASLVKSIGDLKVGTVIYVEMDENDGLVMIKKKYVLC